MDKNKIINNKQTCICYHPYENRLHMILNCPSMWISVTSA